MESNISSRKHLGVLMVTGVYHPEVSGAANQCRQLVNALRDKVSFTVFTTTQDPNLPLRSQVDDVNVFRLPLKERNVFEYFKAILIFTTLFLSQRRDFQVVHLHGFSFKSALVVLLSKILQKKIITKMTSVGYDDPISMRWRGFPLNYFFSKADTYVSMNPEFEKLYHQSELPANQLKRIPNGVDTDRFHPVTDMEKTKLRNKLQLPEKMKIILFVGHFSSEKCPEVLLEAWIENVVETFPETGIVFIGSTNPDHYEVNIDLVTEIKKLANSYINDQIFFVENTYEIEEYYQSVDLFVLSSKREGLPNALLETMACGLPVITSRIEEVTD